MGRRGQGAHEILHEARERELREARHVRHAVEARGVREGHAVTCVGRGLPRLCAARPGDLHTGRRPRSRGQSRRCACVRANGRGAAHLHVQCTVGCDSADDAEPPLEHKLHVDRMLLAKGSLPVHRIHCDHRIGRMHGSEGMQWLPSFA